MRPSLYVVGLPVINRCRTDAPSGSARIVQALSNLPAERRLTLCDRPVTHPVLVPKMRQNLNRRTDSWSSAGVPPPPGPARTQCCGRAVIYFKKIPPRRGGDRRRAISIFYIMIWTIKTSTARTSKTVADASICPAATIHHAPAFTTSPAKSITLLPRSFNDDDDGILLSL